MECLALVEVTHAANTATPSLSTRSARAAVTSHSQSFHFVTFAVEIEGEAPLFIHAETFDE